MGGTSMLLLLLFFFIVVEVARVGASVWLSVWSGAGRHPPHKVSYYIGIYAGISSGQVQSLDFHFDPLPLFEMMEMK
jgi:hypothetical protein